MDGTELTGAELPYRSKDDPLDRGRGRGRSAVGKMLLAGAVEPWPAGGPRRIRLAAVADFSAPTLTAYVDGAPAPPRNLGLGNFREHF